MAINIPDDILILIFLCCLRLEPHDTTSTRLSHICTSWRALALDTAQLWTNITFNMHSKTKIGVEPSIYFARQAEWIRRSKGALLHIQIRGLESTLVSEARERARWVVDLLKPQAHRWKTLGLKAGTMEAIENFFQQGECLAVPHLITLEIPSFWCSSQGTIHCFKPGAAPSLRRLVAPTWLNFDRSFIESLEGLQHIDISAFNFSEDVAEGAKEIVAIVRRSPHLEYLELRDASSPRPFRWERPAESTRDVFIASKLSAMAIAGVDLQAAVLPFLQIPSITSCSWSFIPELLPVIHTYNSFPNLQSMDITHSGFPHNYPLPGLPGFLSQLHALESLTISMLLLIEGTSDKEWIRRFSNICPALRTLKLEWGLGISVDAMKAMVTGRTVWGNPLTSLTLEVVFGPEVPEGLVAWLEGNVAEVVVVDDDNMGFGVFD